MTTSRFIVLEGSEAEEYLQKNIADSIGMGLSEEYAKIIARNSLTARNEVAKLEIVYEEDIL